MGLWPKFKSLTGECSTSIQPNNLQSSLNVNEEYLEAFRTKSYIDIWSRVQGQLKPTTDYDRVSSSSAFRTYSHLSENVLEPRQEILIELIETSDLHPLLVDYFGESLEAFKICGFLLQIIDHLRANHLIMQRVVQLCKRVSKFGHSSDDQTNFVFNELASFATLENPLSASNMLKFTAIQIRYRFMLEKLRSKHRKVKRRIKLIKICKKASAASLVIVCGVISIVTLVLALHSLVGIVAAPVILGVPLELIKKGMKSAKAEIKTSSLVQLGAQLDAAAKGVFFLKQDFDILNRLMEWLQNEIEYSKCRASLCAKDRTKQMLKDFVKTFQSMEPRFLEKLEELEEHVYLCFLNINRFRRLVIQEATLHGQHKGS